MRIAVCEDDDLERKIILSGIREVWGEESITACFGEGEAVIQAAENGERFDLYFFDVYLPGMLGIEAAEEIKKIDPDAEIVFVTMSREFAVEAFSLRAVHYLMKPVEAGQLREVACRLRQKQKRKYLHFKSGRQEMRVDLSILCYLQSRHNKTDLITRNGLLYASSPLSALTPELDERFLTISRGLVVNMDYIKDMQTSFCLLEDGRKVLLSRGMRGEIVRRYQDYVFNQIEEKGAGK